MANPNQQQLQDEPINHAAVSAVIIDGQIAENQPAPLFMETDDERKAQRTAVVELGKMMVSGERPWYRDRYGGVVPAGEPLKNSEINAIAKNADIILGNPPEDLTMPSGDKYPFSRFRPTPLPKDKQPKWTELSPQENEVLKRQLLSIRDIVNVDQSLKVYDHFGRQLNREEIEELIGPSGDEQWLKKPPLLQINTRLKRDGQDTISFFDYYSPQERILLVQRGLVPKEVIDDETQKDKLQKEVDAHSAKVLKEKKQKQVEAQNQAAHMAATQQVAQALADIASKLNK